MVWMLVLFCARFAPFCVLQKTARIQGGWRLTTIQYEIVGLFFIFTTLQPILVGVVFRHLDAY